ncbi:MAG: DUF3105 domain-containing protein [Anaerolineales bacterium]|nr:DUF3105 domain-containing protein [Anaerolineales bacterium]MCB8952935.1 DUF3105 domain-containing protein [Ardenticatenales bacterium]
MAQKTTPRRVVSQPEADSGNRRVYIIGGIVGLGIIGLLALLIFSLQDPKALEGVVNLGVQERGHDDNATYADTGLPPAGGIHANNWLNCGIYDAPVASKNAVHSLEHGAVWLTYQPDLPADEVDELKQYARGQNFVIMSPFPGQTSPIALTAWGLQLQVEKPKDKRIQQFMDRYIQGPQTPELGASCGGPSAVGNPTG